MFSSVEEYEPAPAVAGAAEAMKAEKEGAAGAMPAAAAATAVPVAQPTAVAEGTLTEAAAAAAPVSSPPASSAATSSASAPHLDTAGGAGPAAAHGGTEEAGVVSPAAAVAARSTAAATASSAGDPSQLAEAATYSPGVTGAGSTSSSFSAAAAFLGECISSSWTSSFSAAAEKETPSSAAEAAGLSAGVCTSAAGDETAGVTRQRRETATESGESSGGLSESGGSEAGTDSENERERRPVKGVKNEKKCGEKEEEEYVPSFFPATRPGFTCRAGAVQQLRAADFSDEHRARHLLSFQRSMEDWKRFDIRGRNAVDAAVVDAFAKALIEKNPQTSKEFDDACRQLRKAMRAAPSKQQILAAYERLTADAQRDTTQSRAVAAVMEKKEQQQQQQHTGKEEQQRGRLQQRKQEGTNAGEVGKQKQQQQQRGPHVTQCAEINEDQSQNQQEQQQQQQQQQNGEQVRMQEAELAYAESPSKEQQQRELQQQPREGMQQVEEGSSQTKTAADGGRRQCGGPTAVGTAAASAGGKAAAEAAAAEEQEQAATAGGLSSSKQQQERPLAATVLGGGDDLSPACNSSTDTCCETPQGGSSCRVGVEAETEAAAAAANGRQRGEAVDDANGEKKAGACESPRALPPVMQPPQQQQQHRLQEEAIYSGGGLPGCSQQQRDDSRQLPPAAQEEAEEANKEAEKEVEKEKQKQLRGVGEEHQREAEAVGMEPQGRKRKTAAVLSRGTLPLEHLLKRKAIRTNSGVLVITVLTSPGAFSCPHNCHYCPNEPGQPRSYLSTEPAVLRANQNKWDAVQQFHDRAKTLKNIGHTVDKIEVLVLGGTWSGYPRTYQEDFVRDLFYAANVFDTPLPYRERLSLEEEQKMNETAACRVIGLTLETRPDFINGGELKKLRRFGCTRVQLGIQHVSDEILKYINRGCKRRDAIRAIRLLKNSGFKVDIHIMPDLPGSSAEKDLRMLFYLLSCTDLQADQWKLYPCEVTPYSEIEKWYKNGTFLPYAEEEDGRLLVELLLRTKAAIHPWIRLNRVVRDIPNPTIIGGNKVTNLRQVLLRELAERRLRCRCIRCREVKDRALDVQRVALLKAREYPTNGGREIFLSFETQDEKVIFGFLRLRLPQDVSPSRREVPFRCLANAALLRELHVYGVLVAHGEEKQECDTRPQHAGLGKRLILAAELIAMTRGFFRMAVIAGVGTREYYRKYGYTLQETYMVKQLTPPGNTLADIQPYRDALGVDPLEVVQVDLSAAGRLLLQPLPSAKSASKAYVKRRGRSKGKEKKKGNPSAAAEVAAVTPRVDGTAATSSGGRRGDNVAEVASHRGAAAPAVGGGRRGTKGRRTKEEAEKKQRQEGGQAGEEEVGCEERQEGKDRQMAKRFAAEKDRKAKEAKSAKGEKTLINQVGANHMEGGNEESDYGATEEQEGDSDEERAAKDRMQGQPKYGRAREPISAVDWQTKTPSGSFHEEAKKQYKEGEKGERSAATEGICFTAPEEEGIFFLQLHDATAETQSTSSERKKQSQQKRIRKEKKTGAETAAAGARAADESEDDAASFFCLVGEKATQKFEKLSVGAAVERARLLYSSLRGNVVAASSCVQPLEIGMSFEKKVTSTVDFPERLNNGDPDHFKEMDSLCAQLLEEVARTKAVPFSREEATTAVAPQAAAKDVKTACSSSSWPGIVLRCLLHRWEVLKGKTGVSAQALGAVLLCAVALPTLLFIARQAKK